MKAHTETFKTKINANGGFLNCYLKNGDTKIDTNNIVSATINVETDILKSIMYGLTLETKIEIPSEVRYYFGVSNDGVNYEYLDYGIFKVKDDETQFDESDQVYTYVLYDKMLNSMIDYHSLKNGTFPMSLGQYFENVCKDIGLEAQNTTFTNSDKVIDSDIFNEAGYTYRDVLDQIAEASGSFIRINANGKVEVFTPVETNETINEDYITGYNSQFNKKYGVINSLVLSRSAESDNVYIKDDDSIATNGLCELKIKNNQIMNFNNRSEYLQGIFNNINGLTYYLNDYISFGIGYLEAGDIYNVQIDGTNYKCLMLNDEQVYNGGNLEENIHTEMPQTSVTDYTKADKTDQKINQTYIIVDKQNQKIESVVSRTENLSKEISGVGNVSITNYADFGTLKIKGNISLLYGNNGDEYGYDLQFKEDLLFNDNLKFTDGVPLLDKLYPSNNLYGKNMNLLATYEDKVIVIPLPINYLNYINDSLCDEFVYSNGECYILRKIGANENREKYVLNSFVKEPIDWTKPALPNGDFTLSMQCFEFANIYVEYMPQNMYSDTFAKDIELKSAITQTQEEIDLRVKKGEVIAAINLTSEEAQINADKINLAGKTINLTSDNIAINSTNFKVDKNGNVTATNGNFSGTINSNNATINGGSVTLTSVSDTAKLKLIDSEISSCNFGLSARTLKWYGQNGGYLGITNQLTTPTILLQNSGNTSSTTITATYVQTPYVNQTSLASNKKNIELLEEKALNEIENIDIYKYHLNFEEDTCKKHLGFVIGDGYNYSKLITNNDNTGVDTYSMVSLCLKAIKEQQEEIKILKEKITNLEEKQINATINEEGTNE